MKRQKLTEGGGGGRGMRMEGFWDPVNDPLTVFSNSDPVFKLSFENVTHFQLHQTSPKTISSIILFIDFRLLNIRQVLKMKKNYLY